jgi:tetratricopeptide (TPR) repeat protein
MRGVEAQASTSAESPLGVVSFPVSCSAAAQAEFNRAVALLHHMTYPRAREAFVRVAAMDSSCAMAHWGIAMTLFQPLWPTRPGPRELQRGWEAVERARALSPPTEREGRFIAAAAAFFNEPQSTDYWTRIRRWESGMAQVYEGFPTDPEAAAFYALALLAVPAPNPDSGQVSAARASGFLHWVHERYREHPGAMHYLVHANDMPGREDDSPAIVRQYESVAPRNPHALHMPTHIYTRLGDWDASIKGNLLAADAALSQPAGDSGQYVWDEFPHAIEYLIYAYLQKGAYDSARAQLSRLEATARLEPTFKTAFHLASSRARFVLERRAWREAMALIPRDPPALAWERFPWPEAITWFAIGLGAAHEGALDPASAALDQLHALDERARHIGEDLFSRNIRILALELESWLAHAKGDSTAPATMRQAVELERTPKHAVTPGPTIPASELLGDLLLAENRPAEALEAYQASLKAYPGRWNSLAGVKQALPVH